MIYNKSQELVTAKHEESIRQLIDSAIANPVSGNTKEQTAVHLLHRVISHVYRRAKGLDFGDSPLKELCHLEDRAGYLALNFCEEEIEED
ncbi:MAG: hypothetical protein AAFY76_09055 [Cyanobacteria bacterium J06649_11]